MSHTAFAFDPDWMSTLTAPFMANAFLAGLCIALEAFFVADQVHSSDLSRHL